MLIQAVLGGAVPIPWPQLRVPPQEPARSAGLPGWFEAACRPAETLVWVLWAEIRLALRPQSPRPTQIDLNDAVQCLHCSRFAGGIIQFAGCDTAMPMVFAATKPNVFCFFSLLPMSPVAT